MASLERYEQMRREINVVLASPPRLLSGCKPLARNHLAIWLSVVTVHHRQIELAQAQTMLSDCRGLQ
jgi:hypothetical protein